MPFSCASVIFDNPQRNEQRIEETLANSRWPRDLKLLEENLADVRDRLGERRRSFRNLKRLNLLLKLLLIDIGGDADAVEWARVMHENHAVYNGAPPPLRLMDGGVLRRVGLKIVAP